MSDIIFLVLRRLRAPLTLLVVVYAIATLGMTLIEGVTPRGESYHMSFFQAFYFVSFMGTTIGFGEIPYEFTDTQRAWVIVCMYISVIAWLYAIGTSLSLIQDTTFRQALANHALTRSIRRLDDPFYIIAGLGETGSLVNRGLASLGLRSVLIDLSSEAASILELQDLPFAPIVLRADATEPRNLESAGINHRRCCGVIAVTENDHTNLQVAVSSKLMNPQVPVLCRSEIEDEAENMASFNTNAIINPFFQFAKRLNLLAHNPSLHQLQNWLINQYSKSPFSGRLPKKGLWIICGFGRLGKAIEEELSRDDIEIQFIDPDPLKSQAPAGSVIGRGTEAKTLLEADIKRATTIVAASNDDANNLSILITAEHLNKNIYKIARVSKGSNIPLFVTAGADYIMQRSQIVANELLTLISRPLVANFIKYSENLSSESVSDLNQKIEAIKGSKDPQTWRLVIEPKSAPAICSHLQRGGSLRLDQISNSRKRRLKKSLPLLLQRGSLSQLLPSADTVLQAGDQILFCSAQNSLLLAQLLCHNEELIDSLINENHHHIPFLRWLHRFRKQAARP